MHSHRSASGRKTAGGIFTPPTFIVTARAATILKLPPALPAVRFTNPASHRMDFLAYYTYTGADAHAAGRHQQRDENGEVKGFQSGTGTASSYKPLTSHFSHPTPIFRVVTIYFGGG